MHALKSSVKAGCPHEGTEDQHRTTGMSKNVDNSVIYIQYIGYGVGLWCIEPEFYNILPLLRMNSLHFDKENPLP